jgi:purine nucleoside phosphorylase
MRLGIIGGTGSTGLLPAGLPVQLPPAAASAPWGAPSGPVLHSMVQGHDVYFLARHGAPAIAPHRVNYRANVWALGQLGLDHVLAINAVGGISPTTRPGCLVLPDQLIDYSWGREHSYYGDGRLPLQHVEFTTPFCATFRDLLLAAGRGLDPGLVPSATYGVTQGPRLETAAEIDRLDRDGCHVVGMTGMPEAGLARELGLSYAMCCVVVNYAAGRGPAGSGIHAQMADSLEAGMARVRQLIEALLGP